MRETFDFSARCQSTGYRRAIMEEVIRREQELGIEPDPVLDAWMKALSFGGKGNLIVEARRAGPCGRSPCTPPCCVGLYTPRS